MNFYCSDFQKPESHFRHFWWLENSDSRFLNPRLHVTKSFKYVVDPRSKAEQFWIFIFSKVQSGAPTIKWAPVSLNISEYWHRNTLNFRNHNNLAIYYCTLCPRNTSELIFPNSITRDSLCSEYLFQRCIILGKIILILGEIMKEFEKVKV